MTSGIVTNAERQAAEVGSTNRNVAANPAHRATITGGRTQPPLSGRVRGTGVPMARNESAECAVICNVTEQTWILHRTHGTFVVAGRDASPNGESTAGEVSALDAIDSIDASTAPASGNHDSSAARTSHSESVAKPYALTRISARTGAIDLGDKRTLEFPISARDIAEDLAREINSDGGESSYFGVFVCEGAVPSEEELADARERLAQFYASLVNSADKQWERTHNVAFISDLERRAARALRLEKDWSYEPTMRNECPACGERLRPNVAVCRTCGAVLDRAKAAQWGLVAAEANQRAADTPAKPTQLER
jgi:hypothetical protein